MSNLLIVLGVLFIALAIIVPLAEKFATPISEEKSASYSKIIMGLMSALIIISAVKYFMG